MIGPYQVVSSGPADMPWCVVNVDSGSTVHMDYGQGWAGYSADRAEAARMAAVWNRCWMEDQASELADVDVKPSGWNPRCTNTADCQCSSCYDGPLGSGD